MTRSIFTSLISKIDFVLLLATLTLITIGLLSIYSATHSSAVIVHFQKQLFWVTIGILLIFLILIAPPRFFHYSAYIIYGIAVLLLLLVLLFGKKISGNAGWFGIGSFGIQPSEFGKVATVIMLARFLSDSTTNLASMKDVAKSLGIVLIPWLLILLQPDFGTGLIYLAIFIPMIFWAGAEMFILLVLVSPLIIAIVAVFNLWLFLAATIVIVSVFYFLHRNIGVALLFLVVNLSIGFTTDYFYDHIPEYQKKRIAVFLDPTKDPQAAGYNVIQSKVAIGSGGITGKGYLKGSQTQLRFIPEQWTDFIYCVPTEEFGFLGGSFVIFLYGLVVFRGLKISFEHESRFASAACLGIVATFVVHIFVNVGMTMGMLPVIGIPLPFMSYGGSSFLTSAIMVGILLHSYSYRSGIE